MLAGRSAVRLRTEASAQAKVEPISSSTPRLGVPAPRRPGSTSRATPRKPSTIPARTSAGGAGPAGPEPFEQRGPHRDHGHQQRGESRGNGLLHPDHRPIPHQEEERAQEERPAPLHRAGPGRAGETGPAVQDAAGQQEPCRGHQERRDGLDREGDGEVGRAPDRGRWRRRPATSGAAGGQRSQAPWAGLLCRWAAAGPGLPSRWRGRWCCGCCGRP